MAENGRPQSLYWQVPYKGRGGSGTSAVEPATVAKVKAPLNEVHEGIVTGWRWPRVNWNPRLFLKTPIA